MTINVTHGVSEDMASFHWRSLVSWVYDGVDYTIAGNGGKFCAQFLSFEQKVIESVLAVVYGVLLIYWSYSRIRLPQPESQCEQKSSSIKQFLLVFLCLTFGIELGFKFATRQMIWLVNPCHVTTMMQIYMLAARPSRLVTAIFRVNVYMLAGATIAIVFPVVNTRLLLFEAGVYYVQHYLILFIPLYLIRLGGAYSLEPVSDMSWVSFSLGVILIYHFTLLQYISMLTWINLNNMICPAVSDPFHGPYYRILAVGHESLLIPLHGKLYTWLGSKLWSKKSVEKDITYVDASENTNNTTEMANANIQHVKRA